MISTEICWGEEPNTPQNGKCATLALHLWKLNNTIWLRDYPVGNLRAAIQLARAPREDEDLYRLQVKEHLIHFGFRLRTCNLLYRHPRVVRRQILYSNGHSSCHVTVLRMQVYLEPRSLYFQSEQFDWCLSRSGSSWPGGVTKAAGQDATRGHACLLQ